jgi:hypothetical protein
MENAADPDIVRKTLGLPDAGDPWRAEWAASQASFGAEEPEFLSLRFVKEACEFLRTSPEPAAAFARVATEFGRNPALKCWAWHCHYLLFHAAETDRLKPGWWPPAPPGLNETSGMFYACVLLSGLSHTRALHKARGIDEKVTVDTLQDLDLWMREHRARFGVWGLSQHEWLRRHFQGSLYRLGRLQFEFARFHHDFRFYRNRKDRRVAAFAPPDQVFRGDGQFDGANGIPDPSGAWTSAFAVRDHTVWGNPVSVDGRALRDPIELPLSEWELALRINDPSLAVHIPAGSPMTHAECLASFNQARAFFPMHFPERPFGSFNCDSWLLDHQLERCLAATTNIVRFLREFYLLPSPAACDGQTIQRVFGWDVSDPMGAPLETSLQRHIVAHMKDGGRWRNAIGVLLPDDLSRGPQWYRTSSAGAPWAAAI